MLEQPVAVTPQPPLFTNPRLDRLASVMGTFALLAIGANAANDHAAAARRSQPMPPLHGVYEVEQVERNGVAMPRLFTDVSLWRRLILDRGSGAVAFARDTLRFAVKVDTASARLSFVFRRDPKHPSQWSYRLPDADHLVLAGVDDLRERVRPAPEGTPDRAVGTATASQREDSMQVTLSRIDLASLPLLRSPPWFR